MIPAASVSVAAALAEREGRIFLARRGGHKPSGGLWELPEARWKPARTRWRPSLGN